MIVAALAAAAALAAGCHTVEGLGQDLECTGEAIQEALE
jgi:predicted small secreted protein